MYSSNSNDIARYFKKLFSAKQELLICSPFISPNFLTDLIEISRHGIKIKILTSLGNNQFYRSTLWLIKEFDGIPNFETKIIEKLHAKIYIADNMFVISGSVNLTDAGIKSNIEQISITESQHEIHTLKNIFEQIWKTGIESKIDFTSKHKPSSSKKEKAIMEVKEFIQKNHQCFSSKQAITNKISQILIANYHFGEERVKNYLNIAITDLKINHNFDLEQIFKKS